jgi:DNA-directed RNA polymerase subunit RPC12/RpoP
VRATDVVVAGKPPREGGHMAGQGPKPDFGESKCPDCDTIMKPVTLPTGTDETVRELECPKCGRRLMPTSH